MSEWWTDGWVQAAASVSAVILSLIGIFLGVRGDRQRHEWEKEQRQREREWQEAQDERNREFQRAMLKEAHTPQAQASTRFASEFDETLNDYRNLPALNATLMNTGPTDIYLADSWIRVHYLVGDSTNAELVFEFSVPLSSWPNSRPLRPGMAVTETFSIVEYLDSLGEQDAAFSQYELWLPDYWIDMDAEDDQNQERQNLSVSYEWRSQGQHAWHSTSAWMHLKLDDARPPTLPESTYLHIDL